MDITQKCPYCRKLVGAPELAVDSPLHAALEEELKDFATEDADVLCQDSSSPTLPEVEYQTNCSYCGENFRIEVLDLDF